MTNGQYTIQQIIKIRKKIEELYEEIGDHESNLNGAEINYEDYDYTIIEFIDGDYVYLYIEHEDEQLEKVITVEELAKII